MDNKLDLINISNLVNNKFNKLKKDEKMKTEITLTEALSKLKLYDKKVEKQFRDLKISDDANLIDYKIGDETRGKYTGKTYDELKTSAQSRLDKIRALISNRNKLKAAISQTNAITPVTINGKDYTVVQAIERKNGLIREEALLNLLESQLSEVKNRVANINMNAQEKANKIVEAQVGAEAKNKKTEEIESLYELIYSKNKAEIWDPVRLETIVEEMREDIENFSQEVDVALSIVNAKTVIEIDFDEEG